ncbi:MAG TPA: SDR family oxidoreductase [Ktedonobacterales bacterium]|nr:SDR family oxidoreductase [Ktedonobacterales bacterium]
MERQSAARLLAVSVGIGLSVAGARLARALRSANLGGSPTLIVGGSRGLGLALAEEFGMQGARLAICARDADELEEARRKLTARGYETLAIRGDASDRTEAQGIVAKVVSEYGRLDILVNVASIIAVGPALGLTLDDLDRVMAENFWSVANMTYAALPGMVERHSGRIVNIASIGGKVSVPHLLAYSTAKFAVVGFSEGLRAELLREGITVTTVCPGLMRTGSYLNAQFKGAPDAEVTLFSLLDNTPLVSISAERAARQIVAATQRGAAELIISVPAVAATAFHGLFPGATADLLGLVDSFLPGRPRPGNRLLHGSEQQTGVTRSPLLALGHAAARRLNQRHAIAQRDSPALAEQVTSSDA